MSNSGRHGGRVLGTALVAGLVCILLTACDCRPRSETAPTAAPAPPAENSAHGPAPASPWTTAYVRAVTLDHHPLPGMLPVITTSPNAFDAPVAAGDPTNERGESYVQFQSEEKVCLRAWDPELRYFPNVFHEIMPMPGEATEILEIAMAAASAVETVLIRADNTPAANENTGLMLFHPVFGPWWPAEANTDANGVIRFAPIPPGRFQLKFKAAGGGRLELPETLLPPGKTVQLGPLRLQ